MTRCDHCGMDKAHAQAAISRSHCAPPFAFQRHSFTGKHPADMVIPMTGYWNAVRATRVYLESIGGVCDHDSFTLMEAKVSRAPQAALDEGFVVESMKDVYRLCEIAHMNVMCKDGVLYALEA